MSSSFADLSCMAGLISWTKVFVALLSILRWRFLGEFSGLSRTCRAQFALQVVGNWIKLQGWQTALSVVEMLTVHF